MAIDVESQAESTDAGITLGAKGSNAGQQFLPIIARNYNSRSRRSSTLPRNRNLVVDGQAVGGKCCLKGRVATGVAGAGGSELQSLVAQVRHQVLHGSA